MSSSIEDFNKIKNELDYNSILFYQIGEFYETFFNDAKTVAQITGIKLTARKYQDFSVPMCGTPVKSIDNLVAKLIKQNIKVTLCQQNLDKDGKTFIRKVSEVITPGTIISESILDHNLNNYLLAIFAHEDKYCLAWTDISTGYLATSQINISEIEKVINNIKPAEIILTNNLYQKLKEKLDNYHNTLVADDYFIYNPQLIEQINSKLLQKSSAGELSSCTALAIYLRKIKPKQTIKFDTIQAMSINQFMQIDPNTKKQLEIVSSNSKDNNSLLKNINYTNTPMGSRLLNKWLNMPLTDIKLINQRLNYTKLFVNNKKLRDDINNILLDLKSDPQRSLYRLNRSRSLHDIICIKKLLIAVEKIKTKTNTIPALKTLNNNLLIINDLTNLLNSAIPDYYDDSSNNLIMPTFSNKLDLLKKENHELLNSLNKLEQEYCKTTKIKGLKITKDFCVEIANKKENNITDKMFILFRIKSKVILFRTAELIDKEKEFHAHNYKIQQEESKIINNIVDQINQYSCDLAKIISAISLIDVFCSFAILAEQENYCQPKMTNDTSFIIEEGCHAVVAKTNNNFVTNNCNLDKKSAWLITGPNMAGKSTFLRQNAIIAIMAHIGSFVPAKAAQIGIIDKIFSRIGAIDMLYKGYSTFMVEMLETANIANNATAKSLIIIDEIGRGTSNADGLAIAWSTLEYLLDKRCRLLFSTHYSELHKIKSNNLEYYTMDINISDNNLKFLYKIKSGVSSQSHGIHTAIIAGMPEEIITKATKISQTVNQ